MYIPSIEQTYLLTTYTYYLSKSSYADDVLLYHLCEYAELFIVSD